MSVPYRNNDGWVIDLRRLSVADRAYLVGLFPDPLTVECVEYVTELNEEYFRRGKDIINTRASLPA